MKIIVGSKNPVKVNAVKQCIQNYPFLSNSTVEGIEVDSGVGNQPKSIEDTVKGAKTRAKIAFEKGADLGVGLEAGLMKVPGTKSDYMNAEMCVIYDGHEYHLGMSSAFEYPNSLIKLVKEEGIEISEAAKKCGFISKTNERLGNAEGMIGLLTKGRLNRTT